MPTVLALVSRPESRAHVGRAVRPFGAVRFCHVASQLWPELVIGDVVAVIADPLDADERSTASSLAALRRALPTMPVILCTDGADELPAAVAALLPTARAQNPTRLALDAVDTATLPLPPLADSYVRHVIQHVRAGLRATDALATLDPTKRRSLDRQLADAGAPTAQSLIGWSLTLHTMWYWSIPTQTFESAATRLGFAEAKSLRGIIRNRVGSPGTLMRQGGFPHVLDRLLRVLGGDWSAEPRPARLIRPPSHPR